MTEEEKRAIAQIQACENMTIDVELPALGVFMVVAVLKRFSWRCATLTIRLTCVPTW